MSTLAWILLIWGIASVFVCFVVWPALLGPRSPNEDEE